jgi:hypothetical protein
MYADILRCLRDPVRRKYPEKWRTSSWFRLQDNASANRSAFFINDFLAKINVTTLQHLPFSHDLAPADFYLFPRLKSALTGRRFCDATGIIKNVNEELKRISQNGFQECFQHLYSH